MRQPVLFSVSTLHLFSLTYVYLWSECRDTVLVTDIHQVNGEGVRREGTGLELEWS